MSVKHYIQLLTIILLLSIMFIYLNVNSRLDISEESVNLKLDIQSDTRIGGREKNVKEPEYYLVFSGGDEMEQAVYENIRLFMDQMRLPFEEKGFIMEGDLKPGIGLIFCNTKVSEGIAADVLGNFIRQGGIALFASGIPEGYADAYLSPVWGIVEKGGRTESREWVVKEGFFPAGDRTLLYPDFQASTRIKLSDGTEIYIEDEEEGIPIVYRSLYGEGSCLMINGNLMQNRYSGGLFAASLGILKEELMYPVIGSATVFLDDFPFIMPGYDTNCLKLYGRGMESFERDGLWPVLVSYASNYGIRYTMNLYERQEDYDKNLLNEKLLTYLVKENLFYDGEVMMAKYYDSGGNSQKDRMEEVFRRYFPNYEIQAFTALSGTAEEERVLIERGDFCSEREDMANSDFGFNGTKISFPVMSSGYSYEEISYQYLSGLALYGVISHSLPMESFITADSEENSYEAVKKELGSLLGRIGSERKWLEGATVSEAAQRLIAYRQAEPDIIYGKDKIEASLKQFTNGQKFLLRSGRRIQRVNGGTFYRINDSFYCIEARERELTIEFAN